MKLSELMPAKRHRIILVSVLGIIVLFLIINFFLLKSDPLFAIKTFLADSYLFILETFGNLLLNIFGSEVIFDNFQLFINHKLVEANGPEIRFEKLTALIILLIWLTRAPSKRKILYSLLFVTIHFIFNSVYVALWAQSVAVQSNSKLGLAAVSTIWLLSIFTLFFHWYKLYKAFILPGLSRFKINFRLLEDNRSLFLFIFSIIILISLLTESFEYRGWIYFLFKSSQKILSVAGYNAIIDGSNLVGINGTIMMSKACLGFQMMLLFAVMIILTGNNEKKRWLFIASGILFLNIINILRFVFLFIHLQRHGDYLLTIEAHNLYNYITYAIVFLLWILWFEKYAESNPESLK